VMMIMMPPTTKTYCICPQAATVGASTAEELHEEQQEAPIEDPPIDV